MELSIKKTITRDKNQYAYLCFDTVSRSEKILRRIISDRGQKVFYAASTLKETNPAISDLLAEFSPLKASFTKSETCNIIQNVPLITLQDQIKVHREKKFAFSHHELLQLFNLFLKLSKEALVLANLLRFEDLSAIHFKKYLNQTSYQIDPFELVPQNPPSHEVNENRAIKFIHRVIGILKEAFYMQFSNKKKKEDPSEFFLAKTYDLPIDLTQSIVTTLKKAEKGKTREEQIASLDQMIEEFKGLANTKDTKASKMHPFLEEIKNSEIYCVTGGPALIKFCNTYMNLSANNASSSMAPKILDIIVEKCDYGELEALASSSLRDVTSISLSCPDGVAFQKKILMMSNKIRLHSYFLENVENIELDGISFDNACFRRMFQARGLENLAYLSINCCELTSKALLSLKHSGVRKLQALSLNYSFKKFDVKHLIIFLKWDALTGLKSIKLHRIYHEVKLYLSLVLDELRFGQLESLLLDHCGINDKIVDSIVAAKNSLKLKELKLSPNRISKNGFTKLVQNLNLTNLDISYSQNLTDEIFLDLLKNPSLQHLEYLSTYRSHLTKKTAKIAEEALKKLKGHRTGPFEQFHYAM